MHQIVGENCVLCGKQIGSITEAVFCRGCSCPVHVKCRKPDSMQPDTCPDCGADEEIGEEHRKRYEEEDESTKAELRGYHVSTGWARIIAGTIAIIVGFLLIGLGVLMFLNILLLILLLIAGVAVAGTGFAMVNNGCAQLRIARQKRI